MDSSYGLGRRVSAWAVHAFTASGVVLGVLALLAAVDGSPRACLAWLGLALVVDGVDGSLARKAAVRQVLPNFDGAILDLVIDYLTYVVVPAVFLYRFALLPEGLAMILTGWVLVTSLYCFCNVNMKSGDNYFVGFPAIWNVVALYLWILDWSPWANAALVIALGVLTFTTVKFLHPFRVRMLMPVNLAATALWLVTGAVLVYWHPEKPPLVFGTWLAATAYYLGVCAWRTVRGPLAMKALTQD